MMMLFSMRRVCLIGLWIGTSRALNYLAVGATGGFGRAFAKSSASQGNNVMVLCRNGFLASAPGRVTHDFGYLGPAITNLKTLTVRDWDGGDLLDITGDTWLGWQDSVAAFGPQVAVCMTGCLTEARGMGIERLCGAFAGMAPEARPQRLVCLLPADPLVKEPSVRARLAAAEATARAQGAAAGVDVAVLRLGRVLKAPEDANERANLNNLYYLPSSIIGAPTIPWVHVDDALGAIEAVATSGAVGMPTVEVNAMAPPCAVLANAGFNAYTHTDLKALV